MLFQQQSMLSQAFAAAYATSEWRQHSVISLFSPICIVTISLLIYFTLLCTHSEFSLVHTNHIKYLKVVKLTV